MSYQLRAQVYIDYIGVGTGPMATPSAQTILLGQQALQGIGLTAGNNTVAVVPVPGGEAPSQSNFNTAISTLGTELQTAVANNLTQIQGFATGGG